MHGKALRSTRSTHKLGNLYAQNVEQWARKYLNANIRKIEGSSKHRYLYPLDKAMAEQIESLRKPYPKPASDKGTG
jgi:hypothetical protein